MSNRNRIFQATVAREALPGGGWWLMNRKDRGFGESCYGLPGGLKPFPTLAALLEGWDVRLGAAGVDKHGVFVEVIPG